MGERIGNPLIAMFFGYCAPFLLWSVLHTGL